MTASETVRILEEAADRGVQFRAGQPSINQWDRIVREYDALPSGARWQLEYLGDAVVLVNGPLASVPGLQGMPPVVAGCYSRQGCVVSLPVAYPDGSTTTSRAVLHEVGHAMDVNTLDPAWPYSRMADWAAIHDARGWPAGRSDQSESWAEQFAWWCVYERYGDVLIGGDVLMYFRANARARGWYRDNQLYSPR